MRAVIFSFLLFISYTSFGQLKDYIIGVKGDTLNIVDNAGLRQGKWVIRLETLRGEPGFEEEGLYVDGRKEGTWRRYSLMGDLIALENYRWGNKDGVSQYFNGLGELTREESWRSFNPEKQYDTLDVENVESPGQYRTVIVKNEGAAVKHGTWKYYDPSRGVIVKSETYVVGKLETGKPAPTTAEASPAPAKTKPKEVLEFEKKNAGKKNIRVRDGSTL